MSKIYMQANGQNTGIELDGKDWEMGKYTTRDVLESIFNYKNMNQSLTNLQFLFNIHYQKMKNGDIYTLLIFFIITMVTSLIFLSFLSILPFFQSNNEQDNKNMNNQQQQHEEEEKEPLRDFTLEQLRVFDGTNGKPIYISLKGEVFDVSAADSFYGPGSGYHCFAGREASRAMAKLSFEEDELANPDLTDLNSFDRSVLEDWYSKFKYFKCYPIVGKASIPPGDLKLTKDELKKYKGLTTAPESVTTAANSGNNTSSSSSSSIANNRIVPWPVYLSINRKILDVSYGGMENYGPNGGYHLFTGIDCSKALAKMKFDDIYLNDTDLTDLSESELKVLEDWDKKLCAKYPIVGTLID